MDLTANPGAWMLLATTVIVSLVALYISPALLQACLFRPAQFLPLRQFDTLYMSGFVHGSLAHLLLNMVSFWFFAFPLERRIGTLHFLVFYALALAMSLLVTWVRQRRNPQYACLGASGGVVACMLAYVVYFPGASLFILPIPVPIPAPLFAVGYVLYSLYAGRQQRDNINHDAHLSGALWGILFVAMSDSHAIQRFIDHVF